MGRVVDLMNQRFERLTVVEFWDVGRRGKRTEARWVCECTCGNRRVAWASDLVNLRVTSCGCLTDERKLANAPSNREKFRSRKVEAQQ